MVVNIYPYNTLSPQPGSSAAKNAASCEILAKILGGTVLPVDSITDEGYLIFPYHTLTDEDFEENEAISRTAPIYGGFVPNLNMADKAMLHQLIPGAAHHPHWYSKEFSNQCADAVLPGHTVFSREDALRATEILTDQGFCNLLLKDPTATHGDAQYPITHKNVDTALSLFTDEFIRSRGLVIEIAIPQESLTAYSVGTVNIGSYMISWIGQTWNSNDETRDRRTFGGNDMTVVMGNLDVLAHYIVDDTQRQAILKTQIVHNLYPSIGARIYRATYDVLVDAHNNSLMGVVDPSLRPSASTPAELVAFETMLQKGTSHTRVALRYVRHALGQTIDPAEKIFAKTKTATIVTRELKESYA